MPSKRKEDYLVKCPYYVGEMKNNNSILCVGLVGHTTANWFENKGLLKAYKKDFCYDLYMGCPLYQSLEIDNSEVQMCGKDVKIVYTDIMHQMIHVRNVWEQ